MSVINDIDLTPITRLEYDIDAILNDHAVAEPITRIELILADIVAGNTTTVVPVTRIETYLAIISGADYPVPEPVTRIETFLAIIAGEDYEEPEAVTRLEGLLAEWVEKGSGIWKTVTGTLIHITDALASPMQKCEVTLEPIQDLHGQDAPYPPGGGKNKWSEGDRNFIAIEIVAIVDIPPGNYRFFANITGDAETAHAVLFKQNADGTGDTVGSTSIPYSATGARMSGAVTLTGTAKSAILYASTAWTESQGKQATYANIQMTENASVDEPFYPYSNICPITGWTGCEVNRTGVNVWDEEWELGAFDDNTGEPYSANAIRSKNYIPVKSGETLRFINGGVNVYAKFVYYDASKNVVQVVKNTIANDKTFTIPSGIFYIRFNMPGAYGTTYNHDISINYPSTDTSYHAYSGTTLSVTFPDSAGTVYGGTVDLVSGVLTVDRASVDLGTLDWTLSGSRFQSNSLIEDIKTSPTDYSSYLLCSILKPDNSPITTQTKDNTIAAYNKRLYALASAYGDATAFKNAMNGQQLVYELATPIEIQLTPQPISTLKGVNNVWSNTNSDTTLIYKAQAS